LERLKLINDDGNNLVIDIISSWEIIDLCILFTLKLSLIK
jgi:hypothetical protein